MIGGIGCDDAAFLIDSDSNRLTEQALPCALTSNYSNNLPFLLSSIGASHL